MRVTPNVKRFTRTVYADESILYRLKYWRGVDVAGAQVAAATATLAVTDVLITINAVADTIVGTYTGASGAASQVVYADGNIGDIAHVVNTLNGLGVGHPVGVNLYRRLRASIADWRPGTVVGATSGIVAGATNILLGDNSDGLACLADSSGMAVANIFSIGVGVPTCRRGSGPLIFDHFESGYVVTTQGVLTPQREQAIQQERFDAARFEVVIDSIHCGQVFAGNDNVIQVFDINDNLVWGHVLGAGNDVPVNVLGPDQPIVGPMGSPLFVEAVGTGALTDGPMTVAGFVRII